MYKLGNYMFLNVNTQRRKKEFKSGGGGGGGGLPFSCLSM